MGINLSPEVLDYFKGLADKTGLPYQKSIDLYLLDCAKKRKKLSMKLVAYRRIKEFCLCRPPDGVQFIVVRPNGGDRLARAIFAL